MEVTTATVVTAVIIITIIISSHISIPLMERTQLLLAQVGTGTSTAPRFVPPRLPLAHSIAEMEGIVGMGWQLIMSYITIVTVVATVIRSLQVAVARAVGQQVEAEVVVVVVLV